MDNSLTNTAGIGLSLAVWLAHEQYDSGASEHPGKDMISATGLLKPTRQMILANRVPPSDRQTDVSDLIASRFGTAIHDSVDHAWHTGYKDALSRLGHPQKMIDKIIINPSFDDLASMPGAIPVYLEQRFFRSIEVDGNEIVISGKFDQIINGELNDIKTTSAYTYTSGNKDDDYIIQGSIYRWINPTKVTSDLFRIQHIFTDWQRMQVKTTPGYPASRIVESTYQLLSESQTETWMRAKIREILANQHLDEDQIVRCSDKELWMSEPVFKYYADPAKAAEGGRSTKNFPNYPAAASFANKAGKGVVVTVQAEPKACKYCPAFEICTQKDEYPSNLSPETEPTP